MYAALDCVRKYGEFRHRSASAAGPKVRVTLMAHFTLSDKYGIDWQTRWRSKLYQSLDSTLVFLPNTNVPSVAYSSVNLTYRFNGPAGGDDPLGHYVSIGVRYRRRAQCFG